MENWRGGFGGREEVSKMEDLREEEMWAMMKAAESNSKATKNIARAPSSSSSAWRANTTPMSIPRATFNDGGQRDFSAAEGVARHQSTPVDIPDRSKIFNKRSKKNSSGDECDAHNDDDDDGRVDEGESDDDDDYGRVDEGESDDDDDDGMAPPHEYLAKRFADIRIASYSMCEGVGRTLKGRDLSKMRNDILSKTGFIE